MTRLALVAFIALTACGADHAPQAPAPGIALSGQAQMGVVIKPGS